MKKYEFMFVTWRNTDKHSIEDSISGYGKEGWCLVSAFQLGDGQAICHYLQREIIAV